MDKIRNYIDISNFLIYTINGKTKNSKIYGGEKMKKAFLKVAFFLTISTLILVLMSTGFVFAKEGWPSQLKFVAGPPGGSWYSIGGAISDLLTKKVIPTTGSTGGGVSNVININKKKADLGLTTVFGGLQAIQGTEIFKKYGKQTNVAALMNLYKQYFYFVIREDYAKKHNIETVGDVFKNKLPIRMATLKPGTSSEFMVRRILEEGYGINYKTIKKWGGSVQSASYSDGANLLADNHIDAFLFTVSVPASIILKIESQTKIKILPVEEKVREVMKEKFGTTTHVIPPGVYKCVTKDIPTVGSYTAIIVRKDLPEDLVYEITKVIFENKDELANTVKALKQINKQDAPRNTVYPLHKGAEKYFEEIGAL